MKVSEEASAGKLESWMKLGWVEQSWQGKGGSEWFQLPKEGRSEGHWICHREGQALCHSVLLSLPLWDSPSIHLSVYPFFHLSMYYLFIADPSSHCPSMYPPIDTCIHPPIWSILTVREYKPRLSHFREGGQHTHFTSGHGSLWSRGHEVL